MKYKAIYLPVDKPLTDGCIVIDVDGNVCNYNKEDNRDYYKYRKVAELFLVSVEFNEVWVVGRPSEESLKWLKGGVEVKSVDCQKGIVYNEEWRPIAGELYSSNAVVFRIKCPVCGMLH